MNRTAPRVTPERRQAVVQERFEAVKAEARRLGINRILHPAQKGEVLPLGLVVAGSVYAHVDEAIRQMGWSVVCRS